MVNFSAITLSFFHYKYYKILVILDKKYFFHQLIVDSFYKYLQSPTAVDVLKTTPKYHLIVSERTGYSVIVPHQFKNKVIIIRPKPLLPYSSSKYRQNPNRNSHMLPKEVKDKIKREGYYGVNSTSKSRSNISFFKRFSSFFKSLF